MIPLVEIAALAALLLGVADPRSVGGQRSTRTAYRSQDGRGREAVVSWSGVPGDLARVARQYGPHDGPLAVTEYRSGGNVEVAYGYDDRFLVTGITRGAESVTYGYTASGERSWEQSPAGRTDYDYDPLDRLWHASSTRGSTEFVWEPGGARLLDVKAPNLTECRRYDARGRLLWMDGRDPGAGCDSPAAAPIARFDYGYDERGNRKTETFAQAGGPAELTQYGYDAADRLISVVSPSGAETTYGLLGDGSRNTVTTAPTQGGLRTIESYHYDARGGLTGITDGANLPVATYQVDPAGRVLSESRAGRSKSFTWDAGGRLTAASVTENGATTASSFMYDHQGLRIWKQGPAGTTTYLWGAGELAEEVLPSGTRLRYEHGAGLVLAVGGETLLHDGLGSVVGRVGAGAPVMYRYDAWGSFQGTAGPTAAEPSLAYAGQHWDANLGLSYAQQRWYQPETGRFLSEDPVGATVDRLLAPAGLLAFGYANSNPLRFQDPSGLDAGDWDIGMLFWRLISSPRVNGNDPNTKQVDEAVRKFEQTDPGKALKSATRGFVVTSSTAMACGVPYAGPWACKAAGGVALAGLFTSGAPSANAIADQVGGCLPGTFDWGVCPETLIYAGTAGATWRATRAPAPTPDFSSVRYRVGEVMPGGRVAGLGPGAAAPFDATGAKSWNEFQAQTRGMFKSRAEAGAAWRAVKAGGTAAPQQGSPSGQVPEPPEKLYHYTRSGVAPLIERGGLRPGADGHVYLATRGDLSPLQAQIDLALSPNRGLADALFEVDVATLKSLKIPVPAPQQTTRMFNMPGGGEEIAVPYAIPPAALRRVR